MGSASVLNPLKLKNNTRIKHLAFCCTTESSCRRRRVTCLVQLHVFSERTEFQIPQVIVFVVEVESGAKHVLYFVYLIYSFLFMFFFFFFFFFFLLEKKKKKKKKKKS